MMWNGAQWVSAQQAAAPQYVAPARAAIRRGRCPATAGDDRSGKEGRPGDLGRPGLRAARIRHRDASSGGPYYQKDPAALASFAVPSLLPALLLAIGAGHRPCGGDPDRAGLPRLALVAR